MHIVDSVAFTTPIFGQGPGPMYLSQVGCNGAEAKLINCPSSSIHYTCHNGRDAGVRCLDSKCYI